MDPNDVSGSSAPDKGTTVVTELENTIKNHLSMIDRNKTEVKKLKEMLDSNLGADPAYKLAADKAKEIAKEKGKAKLNVFGLPANKALVDKLHELQTEIHELTSAMSEYLREYQRLSGSNEIEGDDGEVREIVYVAKLVKKSKIHE